MSQSPHISLQSVHKSFGTKKILQNLSLTINKSESIVIIGPSGCGKSVLLKSIIGLSEIDKGTIQFKGNNIHTLSPTERIKQGLSIGMLFQYAALFDSLTVKQNVTFGLTHKKNNLSKQEINDIAEAKLIEVGLDPNSVSHLYPAELSGGMKKRVGLARAIATAPEVLFFDEPTTGLDPIMGHVIDDLIYSSVKKHQATAITITHDMESAKRIGDRCAMIYNGAIVWDGKVKDLNKTDNPYVRQFQSGNINGPIALPIKKP